MPATDNTATTSGEIQYRRKGIILLGMHRSGTSAATRIVNLLGGDIPTNLMPSLSNNNETGFWESQDIYEIHEQMLSEQGAITWDDLSPFPVEWYETTKAAEYEQRLLEKLAQDFEKSDVFVLKDPRICRLLPFWLRILKKFDTEPLLAISIRNPIEVARSLKNRDGFHFAKSYLLWLRHNLEAEKDSRGYKRSFFSYDMLLEDWRGTMAKVYADLGMELPRMSHYHDAQAEGYLSNRWRHHAISPEDVFERQEIVEWVKTTYKVLLKAAGNEFDGMEETLDAIRTAFNTADAAYGPFIADTEIRVRKNEGAVDKLNCMEGLQREFDEQRANLSAALAKQLQLENEMASTAHTADSLTIELEHALREVDSLRQEITRIRNSTSWRLSKPVRLAGKLIGKE